MVVYKDYAFGGITLLTFKGANASQFNRILDWANFFGFYFHADAHTIQVDDGEF
jgi:hypothetical protein